MIIRSKDNQTITITVVDYRLVMSGPCSQHSVLLYDTDRHPDQIDWDNTDRAIVHMAGFLHNNGCSRIDIAKAIARLAVHDEFIDDRAPSFGLKVKCKLIWETILSDWNHLAANRMTPSVNASATTLRRAKRLAKRTASAVGIC